VVNFNLISDPNSRWEVIIEGVFLNGMRLPDPALGEDGPVSALIDSVSTSD
jgi:hypothetical protein